MKRKPRTEENINWQPAIVGSTDHLRLDDHSYWERIRQLLAEHGVDPYSSVLADSERGSGDYELGLIVTSRGKVYQYRFEWEGTLYEEGRFTGWRDITSSWQGLTSHTQGTPHRNLIAAAMEVLSDKD